MAPTSGSPWTLAGRRFYTRTGDTQQEFFVGRYTSFTAARPLRFLNPRFISLGEYNHRRLKLHPARRQGFAGALRAAAGWHLIGRKEPGKRCRQGRQLLCPQLRVARRRRGEIGGRSRAGGRPLAAAWPAGAGT